MGHGTPIGAKIRDERKRAGFNSIRGFARVLNPSDPELARGYLHRWESGRNTPSEKWLQAIADALGVPRSTFNGDGQ